jgi:hypothetical protein
LNSRHFSQKKAQFNIVGVEAGHDEHATTAIAPIKKPIVDVGVLKNTPGKN